MSSDGDATSAWPHEPVQPPRYPISPSNHGGYAFVAAVIMIAVAGMATLVKLHITATTFRKLRRDDIPLIGALVGRMRHLLSSAMAALVFRKLTRRSSCLDSDPRLRHVAA